MQHSIWQLASQLCGAVGHQEPEQKAPDVKDCLPPGMCMSTGLRLSFWPGLLNNQHGRSPGERRAAGRAEWLLTVCSSDMRPASFAAVKRMEKVVIDGCPPTRSIALYVCIPKAVSMSTLLVWM